MGETPQFVHDSWEEGDEAVHLCLSVAGAEAEPERVL